MIEEWTTEIMWQCHKPTILGDGATVFSGQWTFQHFFICFSIPNRNSGGFPTLSRPKPGHFPMAEAEAEVAYGAPGDLPELWREATTSMAKAQEEQARCQRDAGAMVICGTWWYPGNGEP